MSGRTRRLPGLLQALWLFTLGLWVLFNAVYHLGGAEVDAPQAGALSFGREHDFQLYRIDDRHAFMVDREGAGIGVVRYKRGIFPFCPLCGVHEPDGVVVAVVSHSKGDWVYTDYPTEHSAAGFQLGSGETFRATRKSELVARGLTFEEKHRLTPAQVGKLFRPLSTINESCVVFNAAFVIVVLALGLVSLFTLLRGRPGL